MKSFSTLIITMAVLVQGTTSAAAEEQKGARNLRWGRDKDASRGTGDGSDSTPGGRFDRGDSSNALQNLGDRINGLTSGGRGDSNNALQNFGDRGNDLTGGRRNFTGRPFNWTHAKENFNRTHLAGRFNFTGGDRPPCNRTNVDNFLGDRFNWTRPEPVPVTCAIDEEQVPCGLRGDDDVGIFVCRTHEGRFGGSFSVTRCVEPDDGREEDTCGCCDGECPVACTCGCDITNRDGVVVGSGVQMTKPSRRGGEAREVCLSAEDSVSVQLLGLQCVTDCSN